MQSKKTTLFITVLFCAFSNTHIHPAEEIKEGANINEIETLKGAIDNSTKMSTLYAMIHSAIIKRHKKAEPEQHAGDQRDLWLHYTDQLNLLSQAGKILKIQEDIASNNSHNDEIFSTYSDNDYTNALAQHKGYLRDTLTPSKKATSPATTPRILDLRCYLQPMLDTVQIVANKITVQVPSWRTILPTKKPSQKDLGMLKNPLWGLAFSAAARLYSKQTKAMQRAGVAYSAISALYNAHSYYTQLTKHNLIKDFRNSHAELSKER